MGKGCVVKVPLYGGWGTFVWGEGPSIWGGDAMGGSPPSWMDQRQNRHAKACFASSEGSFQYYFSNQNESVEIIQKLCFETTFIEINVFKSSARSVEMYVPNISEPT